MSEKTEYWWAKPEWWDEPGIVSIDYKDGKATELMRFGWPDCYDAVYRDGMLVGFKETVENEIMFYSIDLIQQIVPPQAPTA